MKRNKNVGLNRIKAVIKNQGRSELWVSQQIGISKTSLSNYCAFLREPPLDVLFKISSVLGVPVTELINLDATVQPNLKEKEVAKGSDKKKV